MTFASKLLSSLSKPEVYSSLKYLYATERHRQAGDVENTQFSFGAPRRDPFFDPSRPLFGSRPVLSLCCEEKLQNFPWKSPEKIKKPQTYKMFEKSQNQTWNARYRGPL